MMDEKLRPFQRRFIKAVESSSYDTVALSGPRGLGKTFLAGRKCNSAAGRLRRATL